MNFQHQLRNLFAKYNPQIHGSLNDIEIILDYPGLGEIKIRNLTGGDANHLRLLRGRLSDVSRELFCPYPWNDSIKLTTAFENAIKKSKNGTDVSFLTFHDKKPIGHFFLWKARENAHSQKHGVNIPELGIVVVDDYQGKGLGRLQIEILKIIACYLKNDAIELTTAITNNAGWHLYTKTGFQYTGIINNPLEVDVTDAIAKKERNCKYRKERQAVFIVNEKKREKILNYLTLKRSI